ncbi:EamA family transporter RarD [Sedimentitalea todarodis]|uniref:EamA family transporter RarD n=1 Tax=Sedimentitalea todarodis TaxID=1631240 RepID=A0ABU3VHW6_9RHOB|nr:EamA family transporter RarD [Sedimentitalea todarodis]MDU9005760.1 EamA family transporter RarD [Sedimentitalea todarodis]
MTQANQDRPRGFAFAVTAYLLWGFLPVYMKALSHISPAEVIAHRVIWSVPVAGLVLLIMGRTGDLRVALTTPRMLGMGLVTATLISINWGIYVWSIASGHTLDAALGYYINPLFSVFLGAVLLGERLKPTQIVAILLAAGAVAVLTWDAGRLPFVAIALTLSWGFYAFFKKWLSIGPNQGFMLELLILSVPALALISYLVATGQNHLFAGNAKDTWLLLGCGVVTAVPLLFYANGAKLLRLSTIGILQYIAPTMIFLVAVFLFGEEFGRARMIAFPMIWLALVIYSASLLQEARRGRRERKKADHCEA